MYTWVLGLSIRSGYWEYVSGLGVSGLGMLGLGPVRYVNWLWVSK